jgi:integral membrane sensor domain MASE1
VSNLYEAQPSVRPSIQSRWTRSKWIRSSVTFTWQSAAVFLLCFGAGKLSVEIRTISGNSPFIWLPCGIALAALTLRDLKLFPAVFLAAFAVGTRVPHGLLVTFLVALGNTASPMLGAYFLRRASLPSSVTLSRVREVLALIVLVMGLSAGVGSAIEVVGLYLGHALSAENLLTTWRSWWFSDALSDLFIGAVIIYWWNGRQPKLEHGRIKIS